jgi:hypothetical protein
MNGIADLSMKGTELILDEIYVCINVLMKDMNPLVHVSLTLSSLKIQMTYKSFEKRI